MTISNICGIKSSVSWYKVTFGVWFFFGKLEILVDGTAFVTCKMIASTESTFWWIGALIWTVGGLVI
jgi:hypothetical protein